VRYEWEGGPRRNISSDKISTAQNVYPNNQGDLLGSSSDRDMPHKRTKRMGTQKYLRESCYHCIECSVANSGCINDEMISEQYFFSLTTTPQDFLEEADGTSISINHQLSICRVKMKEET